MADQQAFDVCFQSQGGGLPGGTVKGIGGPVAHVIQEGGLVVKQVDLVDVRQEVFFIARVAAISVRPAAVGGTGDVAIGEPYLAVIVQQIFAVFEPDQLWRRQALGQLAFNQVAELGLLAEQKAAAAHPVLHGQGMDGDELIFIDEFMGRRIQLLEVDVKGKKGVGVFELQGKQLGKPRGAKDVDGGGALLQVHGR